MSYSEKVEKDFFALWSTMYDELKLMVWDCSLYNLPNKRYVVLDCIRVPSTEQKKGTGSRAMKLLCEYADQHQLRIYLQPSDIYGVPLEVLVRFYKRFGFRYSRSKSIPLEYKSYHLREPQ